MRYIVWAPVWGVLRSWQFCGWSTGLFFAGENNCLCMLLEETSSLKRELFFEKEQNIYKNHVAKKIVKEKRNNFLFSK